MAPTADNLFPPPVPTGRRAPGNTAPCTNTAYYLKVKAAIRCVLAAYPDSLAATMIGAAEPQSMSSGRVCRPGGSSGGKKQELDK
jgi:hypothetical protein